MPNSDADRARPGIRNSGQPVTSADDRTHEAAEAAGDQRVGRDLAQCRLSAVGGRGGGASEHAAEDVADPRPDDDAERAALEGPDRDVVKVVVADLPDLDTESDEEDDREQPQDLDNRGGRAAAPRRLWGAHLLILGRISTRVPPQTA